MAKMIKFRAWNEYRKIMADYVSAIQNGDTQGTPSSVNVIVDGKNETWDIENDDVELLQFTGWTDANGKDIYIGDIVNAWSNVNGSIAPTINEIVSENFLGEPGVFLKPAGPHLLEPCLHESCRNRFEIMGNAHANPELLEEEK